MARPSVLGSSPPTVTEVDAARERCRAIPRIREKLQNLEREKAEIKESMNRAESQTELELYEFMLSEKEQRYQQEAAKLDTLIRAIWDIPHANARGVMVGFYLDGKALKEIQDSEGRTFGTNRSRYYKKLGLQLLALELRKTAEKS